MTASGHQRRDYQTCPAWIEPDIEDIHAKNNCSNDYTTEQQNQQHQQQQQRPMKRQKLTSHDDNDTTMASSILVALSRMPSPRMEPLSRPHYPSFHAPRSMPIMEVIEYAVNAVNEDQYSRNVICGEHVKDYTLGNSDNGIRGDSKKRTQEMAATPISPNVSPRMVPPGRPLPAAPILPNVAAGEIIQ